LILLPLEHQSMAASGASPDTCCPECPVHCPGVGGVLCNSSHVPMLSSPPLCLSSPPLCHADTYTHTHYTRRQSWEVHDPSEEDSSSYVVVCLRQLLRRLLLPCVCVCVCGACMCVCVRQAGRQAARQWRVRAASLAACRHASAHTHQPKQSLTRDPSRTSNPHTKGNQNHPPTPPHTNTDRLAVLLFVGPDRPSWSRPHAHAQKRTGQ